jgi:hypothetical protein
MLWGGPARRWGRGDIVVVTAPHGPVEIEIIEARAGLAKIARSCGEHGTRPKRVAAIRLALHPLAEPEERRTLPIEVGRGFDLRRWHIRHRFPPGGRAGVQHRLDLLPPQHMLGDEGPIQQAISAQHMQERKGQGRIAAGEGLQVEVGLLCRLVTDRVNDNGRLRDRMHPVPVDVRRTRRRVGAPHEQTVRLRCGAGIKSREGVAQSIRERDLPGHVANRVRSHFDRPEAVEEAEGEGEGQARKCPGIMGMEDGLRPMLRDNGREALGNRLHGVVPGDRRETTRPFGATSLQGVLQARPRIAQDPVIGNRTLAAEGPPIDRMVAVAPHPANGALLLDDHETTRVVTIPWAGRENDFLVWHRFSPSE